MPTSPLYDNTRAALALRLPDVIDSQLDTLALVIVGISQSVAAQLGKSARALPLDTTPYAKEQRIRRLLDNEVISFEGHPLPHQFPPKRLRQRQRRQPPVPRAHGKERIPWACHGDRENV